MVTRKMVHAGTQIVKLMLEKNTPPVSDHSILNVAPRLKDCWANDPNVRPSISECKEEITHRYHSIEGVSAIEYCHQHNFMPTKTINFVIVCRFHENQPTMVSMRKLNGTFCINTFKRSNQALKALPTFPSQKILMGSMVWFKRMIEKPYKNEELNGYFERFVKIDRQNSVLQHVLDLSSRALFYHAIDNTPAGMAGNYAENAQEILIKNKIPKQAIVSMYSFQPHGAKNPQSNLLYKLLSSVGKQVSEPNLFTNVSKAKNYNAFNRIFDQNYRTKERENALVDCMLMSEEAIATHGCDRSMMSSSSNDDDDVEIFDAANKAAAKKTGVKRH